MISADLGKRLEDYVQKLIETGRYGSKSEVLREGVRLIQDRETRLAALEDAIARGRADADAGRTIPAEEVFRRLSKKYSAPDDGPVPGALLKRIRATVSQDVRGGKSLFDAAKTVRPVIGTRGGS